MLTAHRICLSCAIGAVFYLLVLSVPAIAALDTSKPIICAFMSGFDCDSQEGCQMTSSETAGLPPFIRVDPTNKRVSGVGDRQTMGKKETVISSSQEIDGKLFVQGIERRGWSAVVNKETGQMTVAASSDDEAIVFFGKCMNP